MPRTNPYLGPENAFGPPIEARGWQAGYDAGVSSPDAVPEAPPTRNPGFMDAWRTGAADGHADGGTEGWRWRLGPGPATRPPGAEARSSGETGPGASDFGIALKSVGAPPLRLILRDRAPGTADVWTVQLAGRALRQVLTGAGSQEQPGGGGPLYLPVCLGPAHGLSGDPLHEAGYWHGSVSGSFAAAGQEAAEHAMVRVPHFPGLVRYRPVDDHNFWDWLPLEQGDLTLL
ncbi:MAG TPA: hypothetical protein VN520_01805 [Streptomyces sp.]|uniref:hypothetical protein n=1 Tax=Streptomyces sp. TaxID=1931 RepID=UPI002B859F50|nr:hypothetical protein [Streptomyces sp.]HWU05140.1 hypothetical protein [Streptomyces sp.]